MRLWNDYTNILQNLQNMHSKTFKVFVYTFKKYTQNILWEPTLEPTDFHCMDKK